MSGFESRCLFLLTLHKNITYIPQADLLFSKLRTKQFPEFSTGLLQELKEIIYGKTVSNMGVAIIKSNNVNTTKSYEADKDRWKVLLWKCFPERGRPRTESPVTSCEVVFSIPVCLFL